MLTVRLPNEKNDNQTLTTYREALRALQNKVDSGSLAGLYALAEDILFAMFQTPRVARSAAFAGCRAVRLPTALRAEPCLASFVDRVDAINRYLAK